MSDFQTFFLIGLDHILSIDGLDHILFLLTLCAPIPIKEWRKIVILVTSFTLGHTVTLILASLNFIPVNEYLVELLIPATIVLTSLMNVSSIKKKKKYTFSYIVAVVFGLIHGLGFANSMKYMIESLTSILSFNLGVEIGQLVFVVILLLTLIVLRLFTRIKHPYWNIYISGTGGGAALLFIIQRL